VNLNNICIIVTQFMMIRIMIMYKDDGLNGAQLLVNWMMVVMIMMIRTTHKRDGLKRTKVL